MAIGYNRLGRGADKGQDKIQLPSAGNGSDGDAVSLLLIRIL